MPVKSRGSRRDSRGSVPFGELTGWRNAQVAQTRQRLIETALALFSERGYADTPLEEVVRQAGLTRGALYHHFRDKRALFEASADRALLDLGNEVERRTVKRAASKGGEDPADAVELLVVTLAEGPIGRMLSVDGPAVLGPERCSELMGARLLGPVQRAVERGVKIGNLERSSAPAVAQLVFAAVLEAAALIARDRAAPSDAASGCDEASALSGLAWLLDRILLEVDRGTRRTGLNHLPPAQR